MNNYYQPPKIPNKDGYLCPICGEELEYNQEDNTITCPYCHGEGHRTSGYIQCPICGEFMDFIFHDDSFFVDCICETCGRNPVAQRKGGDNCG